MSKADIIIDDTDTAAMFVSTTDDGRVRFSIVIKGEDTVAEVDLTPERARTSQGWSWMLFARSDRRSLLEGHVER